MVEDDEHWDVNEVSGQMLPKKIQSTDWSTSARTVGMDPWKVPLACYLYMPTSSYTLRAVASDRFAIIEAARSVDGHHFVNFILKKVRSPESNVRLPMLAKQVAKEMDLDSEDRQAKKVIWQQVAVVVTDALAQMQGNTSTVEMSVLLKRLDDLATQLSQVTA